MRKFFVASVLAISAVAGGAVADTAPKAEAGTCWAYQYVYINGGYAYKYCAAYLRYNGGFFRVESGNNFGGNTFGFG